MKPIIGHNVYSATSLQKARGGGEVSYALVYDSVVSLYATKDSKRSVRVYTRHILEDESDRKMQNKFIGQYSDN